MRRASIVLMMSLTGCAVGISDHRSPVCDWMVWYPRALQQQVAEELEHHPVPGVRRMLEDYGELRVRIRTLCE